MLVETAARCSGQACQPLKRDVLDGILWVLVEGTPGDGYTPSSQKALLLACAEAAAHGGLQDISYSATILSAWAVNSVLLVCGAPPCSPS